jgi:predicted DNA-binding transcriptional regulator AlpA
MSETTNHPLLCKCEQCEAQLVEVDPVSDNRGRKTLCTPDTIKRAAAYIRAGAWDHVAAQAVGISKSAFYKWMKWGEEGREPWATFYKEVTEARAIARLRAEVELAKTDPATWLLKGPGRDRPGEPGWGNTDRLEVTGRGGGPIRVGAAPAIDVSKLTDEELELLERLAEKAALPSGD